MQTLSTRNDGTTFYSQTTALDGRDYILTFGYNTRDGHWYLTVATEDGAVLEGAAGVKLVQGGWPLRKCKDPNRPPGELLVNGPDAEVPGLYHLGLDTTLNYFTVADMEELRDA